MTTTSTRRRLGLSTAVAVLAASGLAATGATADAAPRPTQDPAMNAKTRAVTALASGSKAAKAGELSPSARTTSSKHYAVKPSGSLGSGSALSGSALSGSALSGSRLSTSQATPEHAAPQTLAVDATDCTSLALAVTPTRDHNWVHWTSTGETSYAVWRMRYDGAWRKLGTTSGTTFRDGVNTEAFVTYRVVTATMSCDLGHWESMTTPDGYGYADAVYGGASTDGAGTGALMEQDLYTPALPTGGGGSEPAFSPDGRRVVVTEQVGPTWKLGVRDPAHPEKGNLQTLTIPAGHLGTEGSWSPDGRNVAYTRYTVDGQGTVSDPELHLWTPATGDERAVTGGAAMLQPEWRSSSVLVGVGWQPGEGLFTLPVAGGTRSPVVGTANAAYPEMATDGTLWWVEGTADSSSLRYLPPGGAAQTQETSTTARFERPRTTFAGDVYVMQIELNVVSDPSDNTFAIKDVRANEFVEIGAPLDESLVGFAGYDVRQPLSKGTSDVVGDGGGDILARDSAGVLWAFPSSADNFIEPRVKVGTGWGIYSSFAAAGDLNSDNRGDIVAKDKNGKLWFYAGRGKGRFASRVLISSSFGPLSYLAPGDLDGDGRADLVTVSSGGTLALYTGNGTGTGFTSRVLGSGFAGYTVMGVGDFNYDNTADLVSRNTKDGRPYLSAGLGGGKFGTRKLIGTGWGSFTGFGTPEFPSATGIYARTSTGAMRFYQSIGDGRLDSTYSPVPGSWSKYAFTS